MCFPHQPLQELDPVFVSFDDVKIDLGRFDVYVSRERLNRADVGTCLESMGRERMAEGGRGEEVWPAPLAAYDFE
jgi:hypothetical protein